MNVRRNGIEEIGFRVGPEHLDFRFRWVGMSFGMDHNAVELTSSGEKGFGVEEIEPWLEPAPLVVQINIQTVIQIPKL